MRDNKRLRALLILGLISLALSLSAKGFSRQIVLGSQAQQAEKPAKALETPQTPSEKTPEKIVPAFKNIKDQTGTYVFLGWIWVSIFVLIYILGNKIKEADRLFEAKFFESHHPPDVQ